MLPSNPDKQVVRATLPTWANNPARKSVRVDVTLTRNTETTRFQTVDTLADGVTPTPREMTNAKLIQEVFPNDTLILVPKDGNAPLFPGVILNPDYQSLIEGE